MAVNQSAKSGILWTGVEKVLVYGVTFVQGVVLARLLKPEDFGLTAMLGIFLGLGGVLAESGLGNALIVKVGSGKYEVGSLERSVLKWNVGIALGMYVVLALGAPVIAAWYGKPILKPLLWALASGLVINAASVVAYARLNREQQFNKIAWVNSVSVIVGSCVGIAMAWCGLGVWSIVGLTLSSAVLKTGLAWGLSGRPLRGNAEERRNGDFRELLSYGWKLTVSGLIHTAYCNIYNIVIGKMWSPAVVGIFVRGQRWAELPGEVVNDTVGRVALPKLVGEREHEVAHKMLAINIGLLWPGLVVLIVFAPEIVELVLGPKWLDCVPYLRIMIASKFVTPFTNIALKTLYARGRSDAVLQSDFIKKPLGLAALGVGCFFGLAGLSWAKVVSDIVECVTDVWYAAKVGSRKLEVGSEEPIDLVYCWCNGKAFEKLEKCRFSENGELRRSIASADRYAPWFRRIYVFVNDGTEIPDWLEKHPRVKIVTHSEVIPKEVLPLHSSASIEFWLHKLPGLSERFVYGNDDMFFGAPVRPSDFFNAQGRMICRYKLGVRLSAIYDDSVYNAQIRNCRALMKSDNDKLPHHSFDSYLKGVIEDFWKTYPNEARRSGSYRTRSREQLMRDVFALYAMQTGRGVEGSVKQGWRWISLYAELCDRKALWRIRLMRPKMYCLNDSENCTDADRKKVFS